MSSLRRRQPALLVLEDGSVYEGNAFAAGGEAFGEVVFNTAMTGYQEVITDPSYRGQIVTMTYPLVGTYGINPEDMESDDLHLEGFIIREYQAYPSNWRSRQSLKSFLESRGKLGVEGIDTGPSPARSAPPAPCAASSPRRQGTRSCSSPGSAPIPASSGRISCGW